MNDQLNEKPSTPLRLKHLLHGERSRTVIIHLISTELNFLLVIHIIILIYCHSFVERVYSSTLFYAIPYKNLQKTGFNVKHN